jgi:hypothetical protein
MSTSPFTSGGERSTLRLVAPYADACNLGAARLGRARLYA